MLEAGRVKLPDPLAYWSFDKIEQNEFIPDLTEHSYVGKIVRSATLNGPFAPAVGSGIRLNALICGGGQQYGYYLEINHPPALSGSFTISGWFKPTGGQWLTRLLYYRSEWNRPEGVDMDLNGTDLALHLKGFYSNGKGDVILQSEMPIQPGYWHFVVITWDGKIWRLYLNGRCVAEDRHPQYPYSSPAAEVPLCIGGYNLSTNNVFTGLVDEVRIWGLCLTEEQVVSVMLNDISH
jgi:hypothetical protein